MRAAGMVFNVICFDYNWASYFLMGRGSVLKILMGDPKIFLMERGSPPLNMGWRSIPEKFFQACVH